MATALFVRCREATGGHLRQTEFLFPSPEESPRPYSRASHIYGGFFWCRLKNLYVGQLTWKTGRRQSLLVPPSCHLVLPSFCPFFLQYASPWPAVVADRCWPRISNPSFHNVLNVLYRTFMTPRTSIMAIGPSNPFASL